MSVRTTFDDDDLRPRARGGPARKRHWSGVYREKDSEQTATTDERAAAERRARMNHLRRCNEDMRILLLGWKAVEVPNGRGGVTYEYEHPESGRRAKSKKIIFRMHRGEKLDFNSDEAAMLSERVRELRKSEALTAAVVASATNSPLSTAPPDDRASGGAEVARSGAFFSATGSSSGASPVAEALGAAPRLSPRAYSDLAATTAGPKGGSSAAAARSETTPAGARIVLKYGASDVPHPSRRQSRPRASAPSSLRSPLAPNGRCRATAARNRGAGRRRRAERDEPDDMWQAAGEAVARMGRGRGTR